VALQRFDCLTFTFGLFAGRGLSASFYVSWLFVEVWPKRSNLLERQSHHHGHLRYLASILVLGFFFGIKVDLVAIFSPRFGILANRGASVFAALACWP